MIAIRIDTEVYSKEFTKKTKNEVRKVQFFVANYNQPLWLSWHECKVGNSSIWVRSPTWYILEIELCEDWQAGSRDSLWLRSCVSDWEINLALRLGLIIVQNGLLGYSLGTLVQNLYVCFWMCACFSSAHLPYIKKKNRWKSTVNVTSHSKIIELLSLFKFSCSKN